MKNTPHIVVKLLALSLVTVGLFLTIGGLQLILLGGSLYYLSSGIALVASGGWIWRGKVAGYWLYCLFSLVTLALGYR